MKESENVYALWCSGRTCVEGMLVELKFLKRQDLVSSISRIFKPASDQIVSFYTSIILLIVFIVPVRLELYFAQMFYQYFVFP